MRFVFSKLFYALLAVGLVPLSLSWGRPILGWVALTYDLIIVAAAIFDGWNSKLPKGVRIERHFGGRFAVGRKPKCPIDAGTQTPQHLSLIEKDKSPPQMKLTGVREARLDVDAQTS